MKAQRVGLGKLTPKALGQAKERSKRSDVVVWILDRERQYVFDIEPERITYKKKAGSKFQESWEGFPDLLGEERQRIGGEYALVPKGYFKRDRFRATGIEI